MNKIEKENKENKVISAFIIGICLGLIVGVLVTYGIMKRGEEKQLEESEADKVTITEKLSLEIKKLTLKNSAYNYVDSIESAIATLKETDEDYEIKAGMYLHKEEGIFVLCDEETLEEITSANKITGIDFKEDIPNLESMVYINEKGKVSEAVFYVEGFQITYDLVGTKVTQIEE